MPGDRLLGNPFFCLKLIIMGKRFYHCPMSDFFNETDLVERINEIPPQHPIYYTVEGDALMYEFNYEDRIEAQAEFVRRYGED